MTISEIRKQTKQLVVLPNGKQFDQAFKALTDKIAEKELRRMPVTLPNGDWDLRVYRFDATVQGYAYDYVPRRECRKGVNEDDV